MTAEMQICTLRIPDKEAQLSDLDLLTDLEAHHALNALMQNLDHAEAQIEPFRKTIFQRRTSYLKVYHDRSLWKLDIDPMSGFPFTSMDAWLEWRYPGDAGRYAKRSAAVVRGLPAATHQQLLEAKVGNAELLAKPYVSGECRRDPVMLEAMATHSAKEFKRLANERHGQALEDMKTLEITMPASLYEVIVSKLKLAGEIWNLKTPAEQLECVFAHSDLERAARESAGVETV